MVGLFLGLAMLVMACVMWHFIPAFRTMMKWGLPIIFIGAMAAVPVLKWTAADDARWQQRHSFLDHQHDNPPTGCGILPSGLRYCADR